MENIETFRNYKMGWLIDGKLFSCHLFEHLKFLENNWEKAPQNYKSILLLLEDIKAKELDNRNEFIEENSDSDHIGWHNYDYHNTLSPLFDDIRENLILYIYQAGLIRLGIHQGKLYAEGFKDSINKNFKTLKLIANFLDLEFKNPIGIDKKFFGSYVISLEDCKNHFPDFYVDFEKIYKEKYKNIIIDYELTYDSKHKDVFLKDLKNTMKIKAKTSLKSKKYYKINELDNLPKNLVTEILSKYSISFLSDSDIQKIRDDNDIDYC